MKKKIIVLTLILVLGLILVSCKSEKYNYQVFNAFEHDSISLITNKEELNEYYNIIKNNPNFENNSNEYLEALNLYDNNYFKDNYLVTINFWLGSGSIDVKLDKLIFKNDILEVKFKTKSPKIINLAINSWNFIIELNKEQMVNNVISMIVKEYDSIVTNNDIHEYREQISLSDDYLLIESFIELNEYLDELSNQTELAYINQLRTYNETFFETNKLVLIKHMEPASNSELVITKVFVNWESLEISIDRKYLSNALEQSNYFSYIIEIDNRYEFSNVYIKFNNIK